MKLVNLSARLCVFQNASLVEKISSYSDEVEDTLQCLFSLYLFNESYSWPKSFQDFLKRNRIQSSIFKTRSQGVTKSLRYFCKLNNFSSTEISSVIEHSLNSSWFKDKLEFHSTPATTALAHLSTYRDGHILAMDPSSALAVLNLCDNIHLAENETAPHVLDLCCAPGSKMALLDRLLVRNKLKFGDNQQESTHKSRNRVEYYTNGGSVTGVDINKERLGAAVLLAKRFQLGRSRIFHCDSQAFNVKPIEIRDKHEFKDKVFKKGEMKIPSNEVNIKPLWSSTAFRKFPTRSLDDQLYDKILVDAQCTHDGSIKHIEKHIMSGWKEYKDEHFSLVSELETITLQLNLLKNGWNLLKPGGLLVYSTCSMCYSQNEQIISKFYQSLVKEERKYFQTEKPIFGPEESIVHFDIAIEKEFKHFYALRIKPHTIIGGGAFFLCRIRKICSI